MSIDKAELRRLAEAATPGPWTSLYRAQYWGEEEGDVIGPDDREVGGAEFVQPLGKQETTRGQAWYRDTNFIAAANPVTVIALLDQLDAKEREIEGLHEAIKDALNVLGEKESQCQGCDYERRDAISTLSAAIASEQEKG